MIISRTLHIHKASYKNAYDLNLNFLSISPFYLTLLIEVPALVKAERDCIVKLHLANNINKRIFSQTLKIADIIKTFDRLK